MVKTARTGYARKSVLKFMQSTCVITRGGTTIYSGRTSYKASEANQGQLADPDATSAGTSEYASYDIWIPWKSSNLDVIEEGDLCVLDGSISLTLVAVEEYATHKTAIQLRAVKQRTSTEQLMLTLIRIDPDTGTETVISPQSCRFVLSGATPIGAGADITGGSIGYIQGYLIFPTRTPNVAAGDRFKYEGRWGEVTGVPSHANDRTEVRVRIVGGGV